MAASLQFPVEHVEHQVRQKRRERAALRCSFVGRTDQPVRQHAAVRYSQMSFSMRLSATRLATSPISMS